MSGGKAADHSETVCQGACRIPADPVLWSCILSEDCTGQKTVSGFCAGSIGTIHTHSIVFL